RWKNPARGFVPPDVFIPVAEQTNLMLPFTLWSLNLAARQFGEFSRLSRNFSVAVNLSAKVLYDADVVDLINRTIKIWGIRPEQLVLEVTESAMMVDPKSSLETLSRFHDIGVKLSIDDFGTGYSSLAYVKKMPVNELKIDKSFVMNMDKDKGDAMIVRTVIDMAHNFEIAVTAEGVESQEILEQLAELGCDCAQGFHMAKPMPAADLMKWLQDSPWSLQSGPRAAAG
ncbi:MAG: EAL domain-containing protein, partial [Gammaproteobacteria bacterium]|nr:EAL domain-containing protein [Gammaproteobacteria bacterium]